MIIQSLSLSTTTNDDQAHTPDFHYMTQLWITDKSMVSLGHELVLIHNLNTLVTKLVWSLDFGPKMAEFPLPVPQIWRSPKWVPIQIDEYSCIKM